MPRRSNRPATIAALGVVTGLLALPATPALANPSGTGLVISEVYGAGGNSGALYNADFIELYNPTAAPISVAGLSVHYRSGGGTGTIAPFPLSGSVPADGRFLVQMGAAGANGVALPTPDAVAAPAFAMAAAGGQTYLLQGTTAITTTGDQAGVPGVVDMVGLANASSFEGVASPASASAAQSANRSATGADTDVNTADFSLAAPSPTNAAGEGGGPGPDPVVATIAEIQGTGTTSPLSGTVTTQGVVTASYPAGGLRGFYLQTEGTGSASLDLVTHTSSDGLFVFQPAEAIAVQVGDFVEVTGTVGEFAGQTQLTTTAAEVVAAAGTAAPIVPSVTTSWPDTAVERETLEGMLFSPQGTFTVTNNFATNQFGELGLAVGDTPLIQPTQVGAPGSAAALAQEADNAARGIILDDASSTNFIASSSSAATCGARPTPCLLNGALTPPYLSNTSPIRVGATGTFTKSVIFAQGGSPSSPSYRFLPVETVVGPLNEAAPVAFADTRTDAPDQALISAAGQPAVKVASFNVLNYFTTLADANDDGVADGTCLPFNDRDDDGTNVRTGCDLRGAWDPQDFQRQQTKIVAAINSLDADVVGLMEIENSAKLGETADEAVESLVAALNADAGAGTWAANPSSTELPPLAELDFITNALIYKPASVTRSGDAHALGDQSAGDGTATDEAFANAREPIAQAFTPVAGGEPFLVVVNHLKSKGSAGPFPGDADAGDGQGASNESRKRQAQALAAWVPTVQGAVEDVLLLGDFNSYAQEDPLRILYDAGYTNLEVASGNNEYSYSFSGLSGSLDHVLANSTALDRFTGADVWNINAVEPVALEYSRFNYHATDFHHADGFRSSDHDPVVVGLLATDVMDVQLLATNDFHGRLANNSNAEAGAAVLAGAVKQLRAQDPETVFAAAGDLIGASTFESFIQHDKPTIDALNEAGLEVSAVGNHELDAGYQDLVDRVMAPYDAATNPFGGAEWQYLGANVKLKATGNPAVPASWIKDFGPVEVGFVGAVTEELPSLVTPAGIADIEVTDIVTAANQTADDLEAAGADVIVLLVHEGAAATDLASATDASAFGEIVNGVDTNIDAIVSGHTHLAYNHAVPVQAWVDAGRPVTTRPVVSAGQYGMALNQLVFSVDIQSGDVVAKTQQVLNLESCTAACDTASPVFTPNYPVDAATQTIVDSAVAQADVLGAQPLGQIAGAFNRAKLANGTTENRGGESTLGNLVAEVQRWATETPEAGGAQIAFMNPGGLRQDMSGTGADAFPRVLTYKQAAVVQPFANTLVNMQLTGADLKLALEQQWQRDAANNVPSRPFLRLGLSKGFTYTYDPALPEGSRITGMWLNGAPIGSAQTYSVTVNSFLSSGGDNFRAFKNGTLKRDTGRIDLQAMVDYLAELASAQPLPVDYTQRSVGVSLPLGAPATYQPGDPVSFELSSLAFSAPTDLEDTEVEVFLGAQSLGSFPVDNTVGTDVFDEYGKASIAVTLPATAAAGTARLRIVGAETGTEAFVPIEVVAPDPLTPTLTAMHFPQKVVAGETRATLRVRVRADGVTPTGKVRISFRGQTIRVVTLVGGRAEVRLPRFPRAGQKTLVIRYLGSDTVAAGRITHVIRVVSR